MPVPVSGTLGLGSLLDAVSASGGGGTVIPDEGTLSGTYAGSVYVDGNASLAGNVTVEGNLIVNGNLTNEDGYELTVRGYLYAQYLNFNRAVTTLPQSNITVDGDMIIHGLNFVQCGGSNAQLRVGGSLTGAVGFSGVYVNGSAEPDTSGLNVIVYGDVRLANVNLNGGVSVNGAAGNGGYMNVYGDLSLFDGFSSIGGQNDGTGFNAGEAGSLVVYGNAAIEQTIAMYGGDATNGGSAGNGGYFEVYGSAVIAEIEVYGGGCNSSSENDRSGSGGYMEVGGSLTVRGYSNLNGGSRSGTLSAPGSVAPPHAGNTLIAGNFISDGDLDARGGDVNTSGFAPCSAGNGGEFYAGGDAFIDDLELNGGYGALSNGGNGGNIDIYGDFTGDDLETPGGSSDNGNGGFAGTINVRGNAKIGDFYCYGGSANNGVGGNGANATFANDLIVRFDFEGYGGVCTSTDESHYSGQGANIQCRSLNATGSYIDLRGGGRSGATTISSTGNPRPNGGSLTVNGNANFDGLDCDGGSVTTDYPNSPGGNGGNVTIYGSLTCTNYVDSNGGSSVGNDGGRGGNLVVHGYTQIADAFSSDGGASNDSVIGGDATVNGAAGSLELRGGGILDIVSLLDGSGAGTAPTDTVGVLLAGHCSFGQISMADRGTDTRISPIRQTTLQVATMIGKQTLNDVLGNESDNISGNLADSLFFSTGAPGSWFSVQGTTIFSP